MAFTGGEGCNCGLGRCYGASQSIHWTFWFNFLVQVVFALIEHYDSWKYILMIVIVWGPAMLLALLFHELGHIWMTRFFGGTCSWICYWPLGGFSDCNIQNGSCKQEFLVALCGPLMHIPQFAVWTVIMAVSAPNGIDYYQLVFDFNAFENGGADQWFAAMAKRVLDVNIIIFALNLLLPAYPLDAARLVASMCVGCGLSVDTTAYVLVVIGGLLGCGALLYGILSIISGSGPGILMLLIGIFVLWTSWSLVNMIRGGTILQHPVFKPDCYKNRPPPPPARQPAARPRKSNTRNNTTPERDIELGKNTANKNKGTPGKSPPKRQSNSATKSPKRPPRKPTAKPSTNNRPSNKSTGRKSPPEK